MVRFCEFWYTNNASELSKLKNNFLSFNLHLLGSFQTSEIAFVKPLSRSFLELWTCFDLTLIKKRKKMRKLFCRSDLIRYDLLTLSNKLINTYIFCLNSYEKTNLRFKKAKIKGKRKIVSVPNKLGLFNSSLFQNDATGNPFSFCSICDQICITGHRQASSSNFIRIFFWINVGIKSEKNRAWTVLK